MLKTISAALLGAAIVAAPALAANTARNAPAPAAKTTQAPVAKAGATKSKAMNANAKMHREDVRHGKTGALKKQKAPAVATKPAPAKPAKRG